MAILPLNALQKTLRDLDLDIDAQSFVEGVFSQHSEDPTQVAEDQGDSELEKGVVPKYEVMQPAEDPATSTSTPTVEHHKALVTCELKIQ